MSLTITGHDLKIKDVVDVSRSYKKVVLSEDSIFKINQCRKLVEDKINAGGFVLAQRCN